MEELVNPNKLVPLSVVAKEVGYHPSYLSRLAAAGKFRAWQFGKMWLTTRDEVGAYIKSVPNVGRPSKKNRKKK